ncbi:MAG: hypothetical protein AAF236_07330 [Verrucomicrobiota bacterium]
MTATEDYFLSYEEWREAITNRCGIKLTSDYCAGRVEALQNTRDSYTSQFIKLFGSPYRDKVVAWFKRAGEEA